MKSFSIYAIIKAMFFHFDGSTILPVVNGSLWFIFMFFAVTIIGNLIIHLYNKHFKDLNNFKYILLFVFVLYGMSLFNGNFLILIPQTFIYTFIYLLGYYLYNFHFKSFKHFISILGINIFLTIIVFYFSDYGFLQLQDAKSMPQISYFLYAMNSIIVATYLKDKIKVTSKNILCFVGTNALAFYFCQGIGSSLIYYIYPYIITLPGVVKLIIMFVSNVVITTALVFIVLFIDREISKLKLKFNFLERKAYEK